MPFEEELAREELARRLAEVEAREREVGKKEEAARARGLRHNLYEHVTLSVRALDAIIVICALSIAALVALGMYIR